MKVQVSQSPSFKKGDIGAHITFGVFLSSPLCVISAFGVFGVFGVIFPIVEIKAAISALPFIIFKQLKGVLLFSTQQ